MARGSMGVLATAAAAVARESAKGQEQAVYLSWARMMIEFVPRNLVATNLLVIAAASSKFNLRVTTTLRRRRDGRLSERFKFEPSFCSALFIAALRPQESGR